MIPVTPATKRKRKIIGGYDEQVMDRSNQHGGPCCLESSCRRIGFGGAIPAARRPWRAGAGEHRQTASQSSLRYNGSMAARRGKRTVRSSRRFQVHPTGSEAL